MYNKIFFSFLLTVFSITINAQTVDEAVLFSLNNQTQGSARSMATGNAFGALGADAASVSINPAGLGFYRHAEFSFTTQFANTFRSSTLNGSVADDNSLRFQLGNLTYVGIRKNAGPNLKFLNWAASYNHRTSFRAESIINGYNNNSSLVDYYRESANSIGVNTDNLEYIEDVPEGGIPAFLAYQTYLIDPLDSNSNYSSIVNAGDIQQRELSTTKGGIHDLLFAFGGNVNDMIYFGATMGIPIYTYSSETTYTEEDINNRHERFNSLRLSEDVQINGVGFLLKAGVTVKPVDWLRFGVSVHSPEWITLVSKQTDNLETDIIDFDANQQVQVDYDNFEYRLKTAPKVTFSGATFIKRKGFVSVDVDWVGYDRIKYNAPLENDGENADYFNGLNDELDTQLSSTINLRIGGEMAFNKFRVMGGYGFYGSPYTNSDAFSATNILSAGIGARMKHFSFDVALQQSFNKYRYRTYNLGSDSPIASFNNSRTRLSTTFGFRF